MNGGSYRACAQERMLQSNAAKAGSSCPHSGSMSLHTREPVSGPSLTSSPQAIVVVAACAAGT